MTAGLTAGSAACVRAHGVDPATVPRHPSLRQRPLRIQGPIRSLFSGKRLRAIGEIDALLDRVLHDHRTGADQGARRKSSIQFRSVAFTPMKEYAPTRTCPETTTCEVMKQWSSTTESCPMWLPLHIVTLLPILTNG